VTEPEPEPERSKGIHTNSFTQIKLKFYNNQTIKRASRLFTTLFALISFNHIIGNVHHLRFQFGLDLKGFFPKKRSSFDRK
jgi:hypothetical protein